MLKVKHGLLFEVFECMLDIKNPRNNNTEYFGKNSIRYLGPVIGNFLPWEIKYSNFI